MQNIRPISHSKWEISKHSFYQAYHFAMRYREFKTYLKENSSTVKARSADGLPGSTVMINATEELAFKRARASKYCEMIEQAAIEAAPDLHQYILKAVTNEGYTYEFLKNRMNIPCSRNTFYKLRRKFYYILAQKM